MWRRMRGVFVWILKWFGVVCFLGEYCIWMVGLLIWDIVGNMMGVLLCCLFGLVEFLLNIEGMGEFVCNVWILEGVWIDEWVDWVDMLDMILFEFLFLDVLFEVYDCWWDWLFFFWGVLELELCFLFIDLMELWLWDLCLLNMLLLWWELLLVVFLLVVWEWRCWWSSEFVDFCWLGLFWLLYVFVVFDFFFLMFLVVVVWGFVLGVMVFCFFGFCFSFDVMMVSKCFLWL